MITKVAPVITTLKFIEEVAPKASVTVAVIPYVPGSNVAAAVTTPVAETIEIPVTCALSEVLLIEYEYGLDPKVAENVTDLAVP